MWSVTTLAQADHDTSLCGPPERKIRSIFAITGGPLGASSGPAWRSPELSSVVLDGLKRVPRRLQEDLKVSTHIYGLGGPLAVLLAFVRPSWALSRPLALPGLVHAGAVLDPSVTALEAFLLSTPFSGRRGMLEVVRAFLRRQPLTYIPRPASSRPPTNILQTSRSRIPTFP